MADEKLPSADLRPQRRLPLIWLIPLIAFAIAAWLAWSAWAARGTVITIQFDHGYGLEPGAVVRYRGIIVGEVRDIELASDGDSIETTVSLHSYPDIFTRAGSRFWIVRPQLDVAGIEGIETILGARYIAALPGDGGARRDFTGLAEPPVVQQTDPGDLEIILHAPTRMGLRRGTPVLFRQVRIGNVLSVGLTSDGGAVEARVHIESAYVSLIRQRSRFWSVSGIKADIGITGFNLEAGTLETVLRGGVALATPPDAGAPVTTGHRFVLFEEPEEDWLEWEPQVPIGRSELPAGAIPPTTLRLKLVWQQGRVGNFLTTNKSRSGWGLLTANGLLAPRDLLQPADKARDETIFLETAGKRIALSTAPQSVGDNLGLITIEIDQSSWPMAMLRRPNEPEDALVFSDTATTPVPLAASRFTVSEVDIWKIDESISIDETWHGATVVAREDGRVIGVLLADDDDNLRVALIPETLINP